MNEELILKIKELFKDKKELMESLLSDDIFIRKEAMRKNEIRILYYQLINEEPPKQLTKFLKK